MQGGSRDAYLEQQKRFKAVMGRGAYGSIEEVVDAGLAAIEQRIVPGFVGTPEELDALLAVSYPPTPHSC